MAELTLSPNQQAIVSAPIGGALLVLASAGSGKTRVLTERVRHILSSTKKDGVVAFTFTNAAAAEIRERLKGARDDFEERLWVGTLHSIAQRILEQYGHTIALPANFQIIERDIDRMELFMQSLRDAGVDSDDYLAVSDEREHRNRERILQNYLSSFSVIKREMLTEEEANARFREQTSVWRIFQDYQRALLASDGIDFDDVLVLAHRLLLMQDWVASIYRTKFRHVCVDEAQDLNRLQFEFIKAFCGSSVTSVLFVGDPNQMIYGFNGSSAEYMTTRFPAEFGAYVVKLNENYRSTRAVIAVANKLKPNTQEVTKFALQGGMAITAYDDEVSEASGVVHTIEHLLSLGVHPEIEGQIGLDKIVVIGRNRFVFSSLEQELSDRNIPFYFRKGERLSDASSLFGRVLDNAIRLKVNPKDWVNANRLAGILDGKPPSDQAVTLEWLASKASQSAVFPAIQTSLIERIRHLDPEQPNVRKFVADCEAELGQVATGSLSDFDRSELERSLSELHEFHDRWTLFKSKGMGSSLVAFRNAMALGQLAGDQQTAGLALSTVHTMKGLEKDIVFLVQMCEGVFPDYRAQSATQIDEERNAMFVAVTRARRWLYITYPQSRKMPWGDVRSQKRSRFLDEIEH
jgi:DNA helicase-2/ATP-dependent DNA helicase PcrA